MDRKPDLVRFLRLLQLADSAVPIGGMSHSFGLESLVADACLRKHDLFSYWTECLQESMLLDAVYCRSAHSAAIHEELLAFNERLSAVRLAREVRDGSLALGRRLMDLLRDIAATPDFDFRTGSGLHLCIAFGFAGSVLGFGADETVATFLHQSTQAYISAAQRLMPIGQTESSMISWDLKACIEAAVQQSATTDVDSVSAFSHLPELASMRHPFLTTRLFIS